MDQQSNRQSRPMRFWLVLLGVVAVLCVVSLFVLHAHRQTGALVQISQDGQLVDTFPLSENRTVRYESASGGYNVVVIEDGMVQVSEASCPDKVCVRHGPTNQTADPISCLPNRLVVDVVTDNAESQLDGVS